MVYKDELTPRVKRLRRQALESSGYEEAAWDALEEAIEKLQARDAATQRYLEDTSYAAPWEAEKWRLLYSQLWEAFVRTGWNK